MMKNKKALAVVYTHYEAHGPQICAIELLSRKYNNVDLLYCNILETNWQFPSNVRLIKDRKELISQDEILKKSILVKWFYFFRFVFRMLMLIIRNKYDLIVTFNPPALFATNILYRLIPDTTLIWYHNYDPIDISMMRKYSQGWFAYKAMYSIFPKIDLFTLPEEERKIFFPVHLLKSEYAILPNYSILEIHGAQKREIKGNSVKLIFAGMVSPGNGLEEIIKLLNTRIENHNLELIIKGFLQEGYKNSLISLAKEEGVLDKITILPLGPWKDVPIAIRSGNIGINICVKKDTISKTLGKGGTGKTFQYIAEGLPTLINEDFAEYYKEYDWAFATDLQKKSLVENISKIIRNYDDLSLSTIKSFKEELNCNIYFDQIINRLIK